MSRFAVLIPLLMTMGNVAAGVAAVVLVSKGYYEIAGPLIVVAAVLDSLDGWVARKLNVAGKIGASADSIADVVSFGFAPAVFVASIINHVAGIIIAILYALIIIARLLRYHMKSMPRGTFLGLPSPMAAMPIVAVAVLIARGALPEFSIIIAVIFFGGLAISMIPFPGWYHPCSKFLPGIGMPIFYCVSMILFFIWMMETTLGIHIFYAFAGPLLLARSQRKHSAKMRTGDESV